MNHQTTVTFIEKMVEAKQMEIEAITMLLPDKVKGHLDVIGKEIKTMLMDCLVEMHTNHGESTEKTTQTQSNSKVKKVDIG